MEVNNHQNDNNDSMEVDEIEFIPTQSTKREVSGTILPFFLT